MTHPNGTKRSRTPAEQRILDQVAERRGREWAERHAELILCQARCVGQLPKRNGERPASE